MKTRTLLIIGGSIVVLLLLIGGVVYLRQRSAPAADQGALLAPSPSTSTPVQGFNGQIQTQPTNSGQAPKRVRSPADQAKADVITNSMKAQPPTVSSTWTPVSDVKQLP